jgi:hypothetical protein
MTFFVKLISDSKVAPVGEQLVALNAQQFHRTAPRFNGPRSHPRQSSKHRRNVWFQEVSTTMARNLVPALRSHAADHTIIPCKDLVCGGRNMGQRCRPPGPIHQAKVRQ